MPIADYLTLSADIISKSRDFAGVQNCDLAVKEVVKSLKANKALLICGNGGSASDAMHITGELVGRFLKERAAMNCICLSSNPAVLTAWSNDYSFDTVFSRQVEAYGSAGSVLFGISTSGNSENVVKAFDVAKQLDMTTIALTGEGGGKLAKNSDVLIDVPTSSTPLIQQVHICLYHYICEQVESLMLG